MKIKLQTIEHLDGALSEYRLYEAKIKRLKAELAVEKGKMQQIQKDLEDAEKAFDKEKRKIYSIIEDIHADESKSKV